MTISRGTQILGAEGLTVAEPLGFRIYLHISSRENRSEEAILKKDLRHPAGLLSTAGIYLPPSQLDRPFVFI